MNVNLACGGNSLAYVSVEGAEGVGRGGGRAADDNVLDHVS